MNRPPTTSTPSFGLAAATCAAGIGALALYALTPGRNTSPKSSGVPDSASSAGHGKEGVNRHDANPKAQSFGDVGQKAL
ncbi:hypothetical protein L226DRAFT_575600 [Lentinus tigrinus ALCF2SS1-7]|uniref:uncharacterized protein n=1 Tax=Lentinus tigrinus ALCF2SS1-7 TaxID=1328758 RepID=UPI00116632A7|nr:hypothetical protein L226DRAFT_575600 [Lentinus tigrinus ALCF2SS1-7]